MLTLRINVAKVYVLTMFIGMACAANAQAQPTPPARPVAPAPGRPAGAPAGGAAPAAAAAPAAPAAGLTGWAEIRILPDAEAKIMEKKKHNVGQFLKINKDMTGPAAEMFNDYFELFLLPQLTQPEQLAKAPLLRDELKETFFNAEQSKNQVATDHLNDLLLNYMLAVVRGPVRIFAANGKNIDALWNGDSANPRYWTLTGGGVANARNRGAIGAGAIVRRGPPQKFFHPACRYNAMLVIGRLNEKLEVKRGVVVGETPLDKAFQPMIDAAGDPKLPEAVRLAAMIGLRRHIDRGKLKVEARDLICSVMTRVCKEPTNATGHLAAGHVWLRRQAIELIGACGSEGPGQAYSRALTDRMSDINEPLMVRQAAAAALALVQPDKIKPGEAADLAGKLALLTIDLAQFELDPAPQKQPQFSRGRAGDGFDCIVLALGGASARQPAAAEGGAPKPVGILPGASPNEQPYVKGLIDRVSALRSACATMKEQEEGALRNKLLEGLRDINEFVAAGPEAAIGAAKDASPATGEGPGTAPAVSGTQPAPMTPMTVDPF